jgi:hypothetical protein
MVSVGATQTRRPPIGPHNCLMVAVLVTDTAKCSAIRA